MRSQYLANTNKESCNVDEGESRVGEIMSYMEQLFNIRLIDKLARPILFEVKQEILVNYKSKFIQLHNLLEKLKKDTSRDTQSTHSKANSNAAIRQKNYKQEIRKIQSKYNQIFIEGSFKFYQKIAKINGLPLNLFTINIEEWASNCLEEDEKNSCCCFT